MSIFSNPEERYQLLKVNRMQGINSAMHVYYGGQYLEPCIANPFDPCFSSCGDPPDATPPAWLVTRSIVKYVVIGCIIVATIAITFILMRGMIPLRPGYSSGAPSFPPPSPPTPPVTSKSDSPTGPQTANPHGHGSPEFTY